MSANHLDNITVNITLDAAPAVSTGFGTLMLLVDLATNSLDGNRVVTYASLASATADNVSGFISAGTLLAATAAFAQRPQPTQFKVGYIDLVGAETYATGLAAVIVADPDFYGVCINVRTDAEILLVAAAVEAQTRLFIFQSADADWLTTGGVPAALSALDSLERSIGIFHDIAAQWADVAWAVDRLAFDPDLKSATWNAAPNGVIAYTTAPTQVQKDFADTNNMNLGLELGTAIFFIDAATNMNARPIYEMITGDWFEDRLQAKVANTKVAYALRGDKIIVGPPGSALMESLALAQFAEGVKAGHFVAGQTSVTMETVTPADRTAQRIRGGGAGQLAVDGRVFQFDMNFGREPLINS